MNQAYIIDAVRIPRAKADPQSGCYAGIKAVDLLKPLFSALIQRNQFDSALVDDVLIGCSTQVGDQGSNIAKIASLHAGWSEQISGATISRFCCSGLDAVNLGVAKIMSGMESLVVAGGVEQLSRVPMFSDKGCWYTDPQVMKSTRFMHMGLSADLIACAENYSRQQLDTVAVNSHQRASDAIHNGYFNRSLVPINDADGKPILARDEAVRSNCDLQHLAKLPAGFTKLVPYAQPLVDKYYPDIAFSAKHTAGNSPALVDGASLVLLANKDYCDKFNLQPRAIIKQFTNGSDEPIKMLTGHIRATEKLLKNSNLTVSDIDLWEVNESFAASVLNYQQHFNIADDKLNVNGGAIALGHPLGATGGNLLGMLLDELERRELTRGIVSICGGAGIGVATLIERVV